MNLPEGTNIFDAATAFGTIGAVIVALFASIGPWLRERKEFHRTAVNARSLILAILQNTQYWMRCYANIDGMLSYNGETDEMMISYNLDELPDWMRKINNPINDLTGIADRAKVLRSNEFKRILGLSYTARSLFSWSTVAFSEWEIFYKEIQIVLKMLDASVPPVLVPLMYKGK